MISADQTPDAAMDGVRLALISNRIQGIVRAMTNTLVRTGRSGVINTARDFSCCILTSRHELFASAESLPIHVMSGPDAIARYVFDQGGAPHAGDAFLHNSPYHGNSHAADHCLVVPVAADGAHHFTVFVKAHQADCGNATPTTYAADARDVYEEGALIMPAVRVQRDYADIGDVIRMLEMRIRVPDQWRGDYLAMLGAVRVGERRLLELGEEIGWAELDRFAQGWMDYSEGQMARAIRRLPAGEVTGEACHDPFPGAPDGIPVKVKVQVEHEPERISVDLRDNPDCFPNGLNLTEATARTAAMIGVFNSLHAPVPANAGAFRRLEVMLRRGCVVGIPEHPTSCSVATTNVADRVANAVQLALSDLGEGIGMAEVAQTQPPSMSVISGTDPRAGEARFVNQLILAVTGGAGSPSTDAWLNMMHVGNAGMMLRDSVEIDEIHHPIRVKAQHIITDSEGAGRNRGAPGAFVEFEPVGTEIDAMYGSDGSVHPARGARGGGTGASARQFKRLANGELVALEPYGRVHLAPGETLISESAGGGGYGSPCERDPDAVAADVAEDWITAERAREVYGVVLDPGGEADLAATRELRIAHSARRS